MASGNGASLGRALADLFSEGRGGGRLKSYTAKSWHAQFAQLSKTKSGYAAMERAGLSASLDTQRAWLRGDRDANAANQAKIADAYEQAAVGFPPAAAGAEFQITGVVTQGRDSRYRGRGGNSRLRVNTPSGRALARWDRLRDAWDAGDTPERLEELFVDDVVRPELGDGSYPWEFDGTSYLVEAAI